MIFDWMHLDTGAHFPVAALHFNVRKSFCSRWTPSHVGKLPSGFIKHYYKVAFMK